MLRVTLERLPAGPNGHREKIGQVDISNVSEMNDLATYHVVSQKLGRDHSAMVIGHDKRKNPWTLVAKALDVLGWGR